MGKKTDATPHATAERPPQSAESSSIISLRTATDFEAPPTRYFDDDPNEIGADDLPPLYSDLENPDANSSVLSFDPLDQALAAGLQVTPFATKHDDQTAYYVDRQLSTDPKFLQDHVARLAKIPPRPYIRITGHHQARHQRSEEGKSEKKKVVDFDIQIELTSLLYEDIRTRKSWSGLYTAGNFEKVCRGTVFSTRAPGFGGSGLAEEGTPDLQEWCHRYCSSKTRLKNFIFERRVSGWDFDKVKNKLSSMIRATNYRGCLEVELAVRNARVEIYNDCRANRWRLTRWVQVFFALTLLFILSWPCLFLRTKKYETVYTDWPMSMVNRETGRKFYVSMSEDRWYNTWARAVQKAVLDRRQGSLDQGDLLRAEGRPERLEGFMGGVQQGVEAMGTANRMFGWGHDE